MCNNFDFLKAKEISKNLFFGYRDTSIDALTKVAIPEPLPKMIRDNFVKSLNYNTIGGKCVRGLSVVEIFLILTENANHEYIQQASLFGWVVEFFQALFLMLDDVMDESELRRGQKCWYKLPEIGLMAINDAFMIETSCYQLIKQNFKSHPNSTKLLELAIDICKNTTVGQSIDMNLCKFGQSRPCDFSKFNMESYENLVFYKTTCYTFIFPFRAAYFLSGSQNESILNDSNEILREIGFLFQVQDDYLDVYGDPIITGKIGTDIQDGKCSWLTVKILPLLSDKDMEIFKENYGRKDDYCIEEIRKIYFKYELPKIYQEFVDKQISSIETKMLSSFPKPLSEYYKAYLESIKFRLK